MNKSQLKNLIKEEIQSILGEQKTKPKNLTDLKKGDEFFYNDEKYEFIELGEHPNTAKVKRPNGDISVTSFGGGEVNKIFKPGFGAYLDAGGREWD